METTFNRGPNRDSEGKVGVLWLPNLL